MFNPHSHIPGEVAPVAHPADRDRAPAAQTEYMQKAFDLSRINPFITALDAVKARMSAISSIGENNTEAIDATLGKAVQVAQNLEAMGLAHGDLQTTIAELREIHKLARERLAQDTPQGQPA